jgi:two-component system OmpR family sensor kinase
MRRLTARVLRLPIRLKLTLVFSGVMALLLSGLGLFLYLHFESGLNATLDRQLRARGSEVAGLVRMANFAVPGLLREREESFAQILDEHGHVIDAGLGLRKPLLTTWEVSRASQHATFIQRSDRIRLYALPIKNGSEVVVVGLSLAEHDWAAETLGAALLLGGPLALVIAAIAGYSLAAAALRPVESMRQRAATISSGNSGARLPVPESIDEIHRLGGTLNEMLARLEQGLEHERAFVADASHELRSPLTVLKSELEVALLENGTAEDLRAAVRSAIVETDRVIALAEDLLVLAGAERGFLAVDLEPLPAAELIKLVEERYARAASRAGRALVTHADDRAWVLGDRVRLDQAISNLVENALRHGEGTIDVHTRLADDQLEFHVADEGDGFPPEFLAAAFERFARADPSRPRGGVGLGLSIVQAIARAHHGHAHATNRSQGGTDVWIALPRADARP